MRAPLLVVVVAIVSGAGAAAQEPSEASTPVSPSDGVIAPAAFAAPAATSPAAPAANVDAWDAAPWSIGAAVGAVLFSAVEGTASNLQPAVLIPTASLSLERKLGPRLSLLVGVAGSVSGLTAKPQGLPEQVSVATVTQAQQVLLAVGVRGQLLSPTAPVALSVHAILSFGYARSVISETVSLTFPLNGSQTMTQMQTINGGTVGLGAGLALERRLIEQVALRLTLGILQASYSAGRGTTPTVASGGNTDVTVTPQAISAFTVGIAIQPGLELRVYF